MSMCSFGPPQEVMPEVLQIGLAAPVRIVPLHVTVHGLCLQITAAEVEITDGRSVKA